MTDVRFWVQRYLSEGWAPLPIPNGEKGPRSNSWPTEQYGVGDFADDGVHLAEGGNPHLQHVDRAGLVDVLGVDPDQGLHGEIHPEVALVCNNLAVAYTEAGDWVRAENLHMRAMGIREQLFGAMHPEVAQSLANLAVVYHSSSNFSKARAYYEAALKTYLAFKNPDAPELAPIRANLEKISHCN